MLYSHFKYWAGRNAKRGHNEWKGSFWTYDTLEFLADKFGKTPRQIRYAVGKLKTAGLIITRRAYGWINKMSKLVNWYTIPGPVQYNLKNHQQNPRKKTPPKNPETQTPRGMDCQFKVTKLSLPYNTLPHTEKHTYNPAPAVSPASLFSEAEKLLTEKHGEMPEEDHQWIQSKAEDLLERLPKARIPTLLTMIQCDFAVRLKTLFRSAKFAAARDELAEAKLETIRKEARAS